MMNMLEKLIEGNKKALKEMDENPDPTQLRSNRLALEFELDGYRTLLEAWQQGKPLLTHFPSSGLARAMGTYNVLYEDIFMFLRVLEGIPRYYQTAHSMGIPLFMCDAFSLSTAAVKLGELPPPRIATVCTGGACRVWLYHLKVFAEYFGVPTFEVDIPQEYNEESIKYLANQLGELTKFVEEHVPGLKYDQDKHIEIIEANRTWINYCLKEWELKKRVPLPMSNMESTMLPLHFDPALYGKKEKVLEFWRTRVEEIEKQAARGVGKEERLRLLWVVGAPLYVDFLAILDRLGVSVPAVWLPALGMFNGRRANWGDEKEFGRRLTPLEEEARFLLGDIYGSQEWADDVVWMCRELSCDAIVYFQLVGCLHIGSLATLVADTVERELGLPTLVLRGRLHDPATLSPEEFESRLTEFVDMVLARKG
jgi:hypothetical protein